MDAMYISTNNELHLTVPIYVTGMIRCQRRYTMNLKPVQIRLESDEVRRVLQVALDEDAQGALALIKTVLAKKVEKALQRH